MLEISNLVTPSPEDWEVTIKGMRLPFKSGDKSDSGICIGYKNKLCQFCESDEELGIHACDLETPPVTFVLGDKDKQLLLNLCKAGDPSHRKVLRQLPVKCFITAPLYWWKQMDQYKVGTVTNSESTMHTLIKKEFELSDFSTDYLRDVKGTLNFLEEDKAGTVYGLFGKDYLEKCVIPYLNDLRDQYLQLKDYLNDFKKGNFSSAMGFTWNYFEEDADCFTEEQLIELAEEEMNKYWNSINELLPQSYNQTRCWSGNYENLITIINQRSGHKLGEWKSFIDFMLENVPYLKEINEALDETND